MRKETLKGLAIGVLLTSILMMMTPVFSTNNTDDMIYLYIPRSYMKYFRVEEPSEKLNIVFNEYKITLDGKELNQRSDIIINNSTIPSTMTYRGQVYIPLEKAIEYFGKKIPVNYWYDNIIILNDKNRRR